MNAGWPSLVADLPVPPEQRVWRGLRYFEVTRVALAAALGLYVPLVGPWAGLAPDFQSPRFVALAAVYLVLAVVLLAAPRPTRLAPRTVALLQMGLDLWVMALLLHLAGGVASGLAVLLFLPNAGAAILGGASMALFYATLSALVLLGDTAWRVAHAVGDPMFVQAGLMSAGLLMLVLVVQRLSARLATQERLAWQRGEDLRQQWAVTQVVISELPEGVVVLRHDGRLGAINRAAREMLGAGPGSPAYSDPPGLDALRAAVLPADAGGAAGVARTLELPGVAAGAIRRIRARSLSHPQVGADAVWVLEDLGRLEERAQQLKLAAMGRLSASIAHEIRNPLAAIRHANGLLAERLSEPGLDRLARIVEDNCQRIDRIVEDVLAIARRNTAAPEALDPAVFVPQVLADYVAQTGADPQRISVSLCVTDPIWFDAGHLRQVLLNLVANALRHGTMAPGAVQIEWALGPSGRPCLSIADDGPGVPAALQGHLFEPFFTTESRGTGLGLHLAREFCTANRASVSYRPPSESPRVRSAFLIEPASWES